MFVGLLGPFVWRDDSGAEIRISARKERAVLAFLALRAGSVVSTAQLEAVVWGDEPARHTLKSYIHRLRRQLARTAGSRRSRAATACLPLPTTST